MGQTKQELTAAQQAQRSQDAQQASADAWAKSNAGLLYTNKSDPTGGVTKFYQDMENYMRDLNPSIPWHQQLEKAKNAVLAIDELARGPPCRAPTTSHRQGQARSVCRPAPRPKQLSTPWPSTRNTASNTPTRAALAWPNGWPTRPPGKEKNPRRTRRV